MCLQSKSEKWHHSVMQTKYLNNEITLCDYLDYLLHTQPGQPGTTKGDRMKKELNQTIMKNSVYGFVGTGYSCGKGHGYNTITIVRAKTNDFFRIPAHWNREIFEKIDGCGKVHARGNDTAFKRKIAQFNNEYPGIIWI